jgi:hypothetical protein
MEEALESRSVIQALYLCLMTSPVVIANRGVKGAYIDTWRQRRRQSGQMGAAWPPGEDQRDPPGARC